VKPEGNELMEKTAIILTSSVSERFGQDKGIAQVEEKPLVLHVLGIVSHVIEEVIVGSKRQIEHYSLLRPEKTKI
jgi:molybdopterin-guanine dinucleotide biosynthesis protein A